MTNHLLFEWLNPNHNFHLTFLWMIFQFNIFECFFMSFIMHLYVISFTMMKKIIFGLIFQSIFCYYFYFLAKSNYFLVNLFFLWTFILIFFLWNFFCWITSLYLKVTFECYFLGDCDPPYLSHDKKVSNLTWHDLTVVKCVGGNYALK